MAQTKSHPIFSVENYLNFERIQTDRHEFLDGNVYAMAGESPNHSTICFNLITIIGLQLRGKNCRGFSPNMKIATNEKGLFSYPDLAVICGTPQFFDQTKMSSPIRRRFLKFSRRQPKITIAAKNFCVIRIRLKLCTITF